MAVIRVGPKHQITIPKEAFQALRLRAGDLLEVQVKDDGMYLVPQKLVPRDQAWFWTKEWQQREREADDDIAHGRLSGPFGSPDDLIRHLRGE